MAGPYNYPMIGRGVSALYDTCGFATLSGGVATIENRLVMASSKIFLTYQGTLNQPGYLYVDSITPGGRFVIKSTNTAGGDASTVGWFFIYESLQNASLSNGFTLPVLCSAVASPTHGLVQLSNGSATVLTSVARTGYPILLTVAVPSTGGYPNPVYTVQSVTNNFSFTVVANNNTDNAILNYFVITPADSNPLLDLNTNLSLPLLTSGATTGMTYGSGILGSDGYNFARVNTTKANFNTVILSVRQPCTNVLLTRQPYVFGFNPGADFLVSNVGGAYDGTTDFAFNWFMICPSSDG
jgi:hypothetical protein